MEDQGLITIALHLMGEVLAERQPFTSRRVVEIGFFLFPLLGHLLFSKIPSFAELHSFWRRELSSSSENSSSSFPAFPITDLFAQGILCVMLYECCLKIIHINLYYRPAFLTFYFLYLSIPPIVLFWLSLYLLFRDLRVPSQAQKVPGITLLQRSVDRLLIGLSFASFSKERWKWVASAIAILFIAWRYLFTYANEYYAQLGFNLKLSSLYLFLLMGFLYSSTILGTQLYAVFKEKISSILSIIRFRRTRKATFLSYLIISLGNVVLFALSTFMVLFQTFEEWFLKFGESYAGFAAPIHTFDDNLLQFLYIAVNAVTLRCLLDTLTTCKLSRAVPTTTLTAHLSFAFLFSTNVLILFWVPESHVRSSLHQLLPSDVVVIEFYLLLIIGVTLLLRAVALFQQKMQRV